MKDKTKAMVAEAPKLFYRYEARLLSSGGSDDEYGMRSPFHKVDLHLQAFDMVKETPSGYWIQMNGSSKTMLKGQPHWVSKTARKKFAYPSKEEALNCFIAKKKRQISILEQQSEIAKKALFSAFEESNTLKAQNLAYEINNTPTAPNIGR